MKTSLVLFGIMLGLMIGVTYPITQTVKAIDPDSKVLGAAYANSENRWELRNCELKPKSRECAQYCRDIGVKRCKAMINTLEL